MVKKWLSKKGDKNKIALEQKVERAIDFLRSQLDDEFDSLSKKLAKAWGAQFLANKEIEERLNALEAK